MKEIDALKKKKRKIKMHRDHDQTTRRMETEKKATAKNAANRNVNACMYTKV